MTNIEKNQGTHPLRSSGRLVLGQSFGVFDKRGPWWLTLRCDQGIMEYYSRWLALEGFKVCQPVAKAHISVVRGEIPFRKDLFHCSVGKRFSFNYSNVPETNGKHWWLPVKSEEVESFRFDLGLSPSQSLHLTIGVNCA